MPQICYIPFFLSTSAIKKYKCRRPLTRVVVVLRLSHGVPPRLVTLSLPPRRRQRINNTQGCDTYHVSPASHSPSPSLAPWLVASSMASTVLLGLLVESLSLFDCLWIDDLGNQPNCLGIWLRQLLQPLCCGHHLYRQQCLQLLTANRDGSR